MNSVHNIEVYLNLPTYTLIHWIQQIMNNMDDDTSNGGATSAIAAIGATAAVCGTCLMIPGSIIYLIFGNK